MPTEKHARRITKQNLLMLLSVLGPGIIVMMVDNDAGGIATYSVAGARYGYKILWILIPAIGVVLLTELIGLHLATVFYLAFNILVLGKMSWVKVILLSVLVPLSMYIVFDRVFLIPLPEGLWGGSFISLLNF